MSDIDNEDYKNTDAPLLDSFGGALKKLITKGKEQGYITIEELNQALPSEKETSDQIEDIMAAISDMEISIISADETDEYDDAFNVSCVLFYITGRFRALLDRKCFGKKYSAGWFKQTF